MKIIPIEPFWERLQEHHRTHHTDLEFWDWIKQEYGAYRVHLSSTPSRDGDEKSAGLMFGDDEEATLFALKWT